ncbi:MAG: hypothetical protein AB8B72_10620 [Crocinitomicaceae bacterium]
MKLICSVLVSLFFALNSFSQETYTARKGSKFFPGHLHVVITVDSNSIHYQLYNHWYSSSYALNRELTIPIKELDKFNEGNDSLAITVYDDKIKLIDKHYRINRKIKHQKLCTSLSKMRKISFAHELAEKHEGIGHFDLYENNDLKLSEEEFKTLVKSNLEEKIK